MAAQDGRLENANHDVANLRRTGLDAHMLQVVEAMTSIFSGLIVMAALVVLWSKSPSGWLLLALAGSAISMLFRIAFAIMPTMFSGRPNIILVWQVTYLMTAGGLLGYALEQPARKN